MSTGSLQSHSHDHYPHSCAYMLCDLIISFFFIQILLITHHYLHKARDIMTHPHVCVEVFSLCTVIVQSDHRILTSFLVFSSTHRILTSFLVFSSTHRILTSFLVFSLRKIRFSYQFLYPRGNCSSNQITTRLSS